MATKVHQVKSVDQELAEHLKKAENHLIEALTLLSRRNGPNRTPEYAKRLTRAQETVTALLREELVRIRGPIKVTLKRRLRK